MISIVFIQSRILAKVLYAYVQIFLSKTQDLCHRFSHLGKPSNFLKDVAVQIISQLYNLSCGERVTFDTRQ
jgi:hypothetical protein